MAQHSSALISDVRDVLIAVATCVALFAVAWVVVRARQQGVSKLLLAALAIVLWGAVLTLSCEILDQNYKQRYCASYPTDTDCTFTRGESAPTDRGERFVLRQV